LDFNSLYPSIIQEYNICFTTIERDYSTGEDVMPTPPEPGTPLGLLPKILANLVARRRQIKTLMKDPKLASGAYAQLHIRQQALKLTANSMYGCLGFAHSRFFAKPLAMLITGKGREILQNTVDLAQSQCRLEVVYGDTDSVMIHTGTRNLSEARRMGQLLKKTVNEKYRLLEIEIDGVFEKLLLLKKKKYAAVIMEERADGSVKRRIETKGLDLVRRDWCPLSVDTSNQVLQRILSENSETVEGLPPNTHSTGESVQRIAPTNEEVVEGIHHILNTVASQVTLNQIPLEQYIISKVIIFYSFLKQ
jgi:DNA polymerase alpha subunit A